MSSALERKVKQLERRVERLEEYHVPEDPIFFCRKWLGFEPTKYQLDLIRKFLKNQFVAIRWPRQVGKSWQVSALLLWYALCNPETYIAVVGPSWRQTKLVIRRINFFLRKLPKRYYHRPQRTIVRLGNGSIIEAFPNNPQTIRGPTLDIVYCDEMGFIANDEEMWDAILFTLGTTNGKFVCSSTPWCTDSIFWKIFNKEAFSDFARSHITWRDALEPNGPLKKEIVDKIRKQFEGDPWRWRREMEAEWAEDENVWLPQALISRSIDHELDYFDFDDEAKGSFYAGLDLGKYQDYSVLAIVMINEGVIRLVHVHRFPLKTPYASVIGYVKTLADRWKTIYKVLVDMSGVGDYIVEDMINASIKQTEGVKFTQQSKQELASYLKQSMVQGKFKIPYIPAQSPRDVDLTAELNIERFELTKSGQIKFSHPQGSHDDVFWSVALGVYASRTPRKPDRGAFIFQ